MFLIGISAHLFIYFLVPAFLIVCFYCRGIKGETEVAIPLPATVVYMHSGAHYSAETCDFRKASSLKENFRPSCLFFLFNIPIPFQSTAYQPDLQASIKILSSSIRRAPPFSLFG